MTILVIRDGIMAADSAGFQSDMMMSCLPKIIRVGGGPYGGALVGASGKGSDCQAIYGWFQSGADPHNKPALTDRDGAIAIMLWKGRHYMMDESLRAYERPGPWLVCGSDIASAICVGAMSMGASAERAVGLAIEHCVWAGGGVQVEVGEPPAMVEAHKARVGRLIKNPFNVP